MFKMIDGLMKRAIWPGVALAFVGTGFAMVLHFAYEVWAPYGDVAVTVVLLIALMAMVVATGLTAKMWFAAIRRLKQEG